VFFSPSADLGGRDDGCLGAYGNGYQVGDMVVMRVRDKDIIGFELFGGNACGLCEGVVVNKGVKEEGSVIELYLEACMAEVCNLHPVRWIETAKLRFRRRFWGLFVQILVLCFGYGGVVSLGGCSRSTNEIRTLRLNFDTGLTTLDPAFARDGNATQAVSMVYECLYALDNSLRPVPCLATLDSGASTATWIVFKVNTRKAFHNDACFKGGTRHVKASDVSYSFSRLLDPKTASPGAWVLRGLVDSLAPFETPNDSTFIVRLNREVPDLLALLTVVYTSVVPREAVEYYGAMFRSHPVGTGAMRYAYWKEGEALGLVKHDAYEGVVSGNVDAVVIEFLPDRQMSIINAMQGRTHVVRAIDQATVQAIEGHTIRGKLLKSSVLSTEYIAFRVDTPPLNSLSLRKALVSSIDVSALIREVRPNTANPATQGFVPPGLGVGLHASKAPPKRNQRKANGNLTKPLKLYTTQNFADIALGLQRQWRAAGISVDIELSTGQLIRQRSSRGELRMWRASWIADYPSALNYLQLFTGANSAPSGPNVTRYSNGAYDGHFANGGEQGSLEAMVQIIAEEAVVLPLFYDVSVWFVSDELVTFRPNALGYFDIKSVVMR
jgi:oligopeptide transport system substrate-binding protein